jgi:hypothetical protein
MLNKIVSVVLFLHCVILLILGNSKDAVSSVGIYNKRLMCLTFVTLLYMLVVVCNKTLTSVGGVPTALLFGISFICAGVKLLFKEDNTNISIVKDSKVGVHVLGGIASVVSILLGIVLTFSNCKK